MVIARNMRPSNWLVVTLGLGTVACGTDPLPIGPPASVETVTGAPSTLPIATPATDSLAVRVADVSGRDVKGVTVVWNTDRGVVAPILAVTDADGKARTSLRSGGQEGPTTVSATVLTPSGSSSVSMGLSVVSPPAVRFNGQSFAQVPDSPTLRAGTGDFTWEVRLKRDAGAPRGDVMTKKDVFADSKHDVAIVIEADGRVIAFTREQPLGQQTLIYSRRSVGTEWAHVAMVRSAGVLSLYINGTLEGSSPAPFDLSSTGPLRIGANRSNNAGADAGVEFGFVGLVHEARVWNVARTAQEIADAASGCVPRRTQGLVGDYRFDAGSGTVVRDASTAANDGQIRNGGAWVAGAARCAGS